MGFALEASQIAAGPGVVAFDQVGQVFAGEELIFWDFTMITGPVIGYEALFRSDPADLLQEFFEAAVSTPTQMPGDDLTLQSIIGFPEPNFVFFPFT